MKTQLLAAVLLANFICSFGQVINHSGFKSPTITPTTKRIGLPAGGTVADYIFGAYGNGLAYVGRNGSGVAHFLDTVGATAFSISGSPAHSDHAPRFGSGVCPWLGACGAILIDRLGRTVADLAAYSNIHNYAGGYTTAAAIIGGHRVNVYIDSVGGRIYEQLSFPIYDEPADIKSPRPFICGLAPFYNGQTKLWGFFNRSGDVVIKAQFADCHHFSDSLAAVKNISGKWGYINPEGVYVIDPVFESEPQDFTDFVAIVAKSKREVYYIDKSGRVVSRAFSAATPFCGGYAAVSSGGRVNIIDTRFRLLRPLYLDPSPVNPKVGYKVFAKEGVGLVGNRIIVSSAFNILVYSNLVDYSGGSFAFCTYNNPSIAVAGVINLKGEFIFVFVGEEF